MVALIIWDVCTLWMLHLHYECTSYEWFFNLYYIWLLAMTWSYIIWVAIYKGNES